MELGGSYDLCELFHVCRFDVDDVEALILNVEIPEVDSKIVTADECLAIAVHGDAVDVVCMGVCVSLSWNGGDDRVVVCKSR